MADAERALEITLTVEDLPREALSRGHVRVGLDPHAADRLPLAGRDARADGGEQLGVVRFDLRVVMRARLVEAEVGRTAHQRQGGMKRAPELAARFLVRPQPGEIDMGVAGQRDLALRGKAPLQATQRRGQRVGGRFDAGAFAVAQRRRAVDRFGQAPNCLLLRRRRDAGDVVGRRRKPVDRA